jgi:hypothetical protein
MQGQMMLAGYFKYFHAYAFQSIYILTIQIKIAFLLNTMDDPKSMQDKGSMINQFMMNWGNRKYKDNCTLKIPTE